MKAGRFKVLRTAVYLALSCTLFLTGGSFYSRDYSEGSGVFAGSSKLSDIQTANLEKLCRVWGFTKYYHPAAVSGNVNWDYELFEIMPQILKASSGGEADSLLYSWLSGFGTTWKEEVKANTLPESISSAEIAVSAETAWITDPSYLSEELRQLLSELSVTYITDRSSAYASVNQYGFTTFNRESAYESMDYADVGYRLLSLFRYWNIIEYYYPYREGMSHKWDDTLREFLPVFYGASSESDYKLAVAELASRVEDSHIYLSDKNKFYTHFHGENIAPVEFLVLNDKAVITGITKLYEETTPLLAGDVVLAIDGLNTSEVIQEKLKYQSVSNQNAITNNLLNSLFRTSNSSLKLTIERDGQVTDVTVPCDSVYHPPLVYSQPSHRLLKDNIGYINPAALAPGEITEIMAEFWNTKGIVIDLRAYPSDFIVFPLGNLLIPDNTIFAKGAFLNSAVPGEFRFMSDLTIGGQGDTIYSGKVMILMDQRTQSMAEYTVMALRLAPGAKVVGSNSIGTDGDIVTFTLPGGINTCMTGWGVYTPDGTATQRVGLKPDIYVEPTAEGIRKGQDEVLERALEQIQ